MTAPGGSGGKRAWWRPFVGPAILFLAIVLVVVLFPLLRPMLRSGDRCHPEGLQTIKQVAAEVCVDPSTWSWLDTHQRSRQAYMEGPHHILFDTIGFTEVVPQPEFRAAILDYVDQYATNGEKLRILGESTATLGGRDWNVIAFESDTAYFTDYYYAAEGFGSLQLFFFGFKEHLAERDAFAKPILESVKFSVPAGTSAQK